MAPVCLQPLQIPMMLIRLAAVSGGPTKDIGINSSLSRVNPAPTKNKPNKNNAHMKGSWNKNHTTHCHHYQSNTHSFTIPDHCNILLEGIAITV